MSPSQDRVQPSERESERQESDHRQVEQVQAGVVLLVLRIGGAVLGPDHVSMRDLDTNHMIARQKHGGWIL